MEADKYCLAVFLDVSQAFDKAFGTEDYFTKSKEDFQLTSTSS